MNKIRMVTACALVVAAFSAASAQQRAADEATDMQSAKNAIVSLRGADDTRDNRWDLRSDGLDIRQLERWPIGDMAGRSGGKQAITGFIVAGDHPLILSVLSRPLRDSQSLRIVTESGLPQAARVVAWDPTSDLAVFSTGEADQFAEQLRNGELAALPLSNEPAAWGSTIRVLSQWRPGNPAMLAGIVATSTSYDKTLGTEVFHTDVVVPQSAKGGPVLNSSGQVVGIITGFQNFTAGVGAGTAIGLEPIRRLVEFVQTGGSGALPRPRLGVELTSTDNGVIVRGAMAGSAAQQAGIETGDRIVAVGNMRVRTPEDLMGAVVSKQPGDVLVITIERNGETTQSNVTLGEWQQELALPGAAPQADPSESSLPNPPLNSNFPLNADALRGQLEQQLLYRSAVPEGYPPTTAQGNPALDGELRNQLEAINEQLRQLREQLQQTQKAAPQEPSNAPNR